MPSLDLVVNGRRVTTEIDGLRMLVDVLREGLGLCGTKIGCREGECGACTVLLDGDAVLSCLLPAMKANGKSVTTIEGLGTAGNPHPIQLALAGVGGVQCGYCTPGVVMAAAALLAKTPHPSVEEVRVAIAGNLCRCTGYTKIVQGILKAAEHES